MSSQGSSDDSDKDSKRHENIECLWCGISQRLSPDKDIQWAVFDVDKNFGICSDCWSILPESDKQEMTDAKSRNKGADQ
ncbi:MAG: hypothetical protein ABW119_20620 [Candidatus Thiodiazotropha lotti]